MTKRLSALLLAFLMTVPVLASCAGGTDKSADTSTAEDTTAPAEDTTAAYTYLADDLPDDINYNGAAMGIYVISSLVDEIADFADNDIVSEAVVRRNQFVEERLNIKIDPTYDRNETGETYMGNIMTQIRAGDDSYDVMLCNTYFLCMTQAVGIFRNMYDNDIIGFDKPWWQSGLNETVKMRDDLMFQLYGDSNYSSIGGLCCMFFNKAIITDILSDVGVDGLYQMALDGKWTYDKLCQYARTIAADLDGDQLMGEDDRYGIVFCHHLEPFVLSLGAEFSGREEDGTPYVSFSTEHNVDVVNAIADLYNDRNVTVPWSRQYDIFMSDKAGFLYASLDASYEYLRNMESEYGILPMAKYDENQTEYRCSYAGTSAWAVSCLVDDVKLERAATFLEAMASASYRMVVPVYYEKALKTKYTHDNISSRIIDLIHDSSYADFATIYGDRVNNPMEKTCTIIMTEPGTYTSQISALADTAQKTLDKYLKKFEKMQ